MLNQVTKCSFVYFFKNSLIDMHISQRLPLKVYHPVVFSIPSTITTNSMTLSSPQKETLHPPLTPTSPSSRHLQPRPTYVSVYLNVLDFWLIGVCRMWLRVWLLHTVHGFQGSPVLWQVARLHYFLPEVIPLFEYATFC